jgi:ribonuclease BN (tRNA processing enzyme)
MITVTFLGTGSGVPSAARGHSASLLSCPGDCLLLDAGDGVARSMATHQVPVNSIHRIAISHTHSDHVAGLPMLIQTMKLHGRTEPLSMFVPRETENWTASMLRGMHLHPEEWPFPSRILPLEELPDDDHALTVTPIANTHLDGKRAIAARHGYPASSYSFVVSRPGASLVLSSDIVGMGDILSVAENADALIIDSTHVPLEQIESFAMSHPGIHVICTHIPPECEERLLERYPRPFAGCNIAVASDGMRLMIEGSVVECSTTR